MPQRRSQPQLIFNKTAEDIIPQPFLLNYLVTEYQVAISRGQTEFFHYQGRRSHLPISR